MNSDPVLELGESARALRPPLRSFLGVPILHANTLTGVLAVYSQDAHAFTDDHLRVVEAVARQIAPALSVEEGSVEQRSSAPQLPGPEQLDRFLTTHLASAGGEPTSIVEIVLQGRTRNTHNSTENVIALAVRQALRPSDFLFHDWPTSLICVLTASDYSAAEVVAKDIRQQLTELGAALGFNPVSVLVGYATAPNDGLTVRALLEKARGRNRSSGPNTSIH
jgi:hypothetical protein